MVKHSILDVLRHSLPVFNNMRAARLMRRCELAEADDENAYRLTKSIPGGFSLTCMLSKIEGLAACHLTWREEKEEGEEGEDPKPSALGVIFQEGQWFVEASVNTPEIFGSILTRCGIEPKPGMILENKQINDSTELTAEEQAMDIIEAMCEHFFNHMP